MFLQITKDFQKMISRMVEKTIPRSYVLRKNVSY